MKNIRARVKSFLKDDNGMEFIQVAVIVVAVLMLAAAAYYLYTQAGVKINEVADNIDISQGH